ncbi:MAG TPA: type II toxin-antitoxin system PemK/MazF family toxin [Pirellulales bacterium]
MPVDRGDVVLALFPFTDASGSKRRPALVVQCQRNNRRLQDVILALITSNTARVSTEPTQLMIEIATLDGQQSGLLHDSAVKCEHLMTVHERLIERVVGHLSPGMMQQVDQCLRSALDLQ